MNIPRLLSVTNLRIDLYSIVCPESDRMIDIAGTSIPLYSELLVVEKTILDASEVLSSRLMSLLFSLSSDVKTKYNLSQDIAKLASSVYDAVASNNGQIPIYKGDVKEYDSALYPVLAAVESLLLDYPDYDPETLITPDLGTDLRSALWDLASELEAIGVVGKDIYEQVQSIKERRNLVTNFTLETLDITPDLSKYPEIYDLLDAQIYTAKDTFKVDLLAYTRGKIQHAISDSLLSSELRYILQEIKSEFPVINAPVENTNEAEVLVADAPEISEPPKRRRVKK